MALATQPVETLDQKCEAIGSLAQSIMQGRQSEVPMSAMMKRLAEIVPEWMLPTVRDMVKSAYANESYHSPEGKAQEVVRFRNRWEAWCYDSAG